MRRSVPLLLLPLLLAGCSGLQEDSVLRRPAEWLGRTGDVLRNWGGAERESAYDEEVRRLFEQPYIDPLTRYLEQYRSDESRSQHLQRVFKEREQRCATIAKRYAEREPTAANLEQYRAGYIYSCPKRVEVFARRVEAGQASEVASGERPQTEPQQQPTQTAPAERAPLSQPGLSASNQPPVWSGQLAQQLNDCYLLTTIRNFGEARSACLGPAEQGDLRAQFNMALISRALHDYIEAIHWAHLAAPKSADARYLLGQLYAAGEGVTRDDGNALRWYREAAEQGHAAAQYETGWFLAQGRGGTEDLAAAQSWFQRAAAQGNADAQLELGLMLLRGQGAEANLIQGHYWLLRAARQGQAQAQYHLGKMAEVAAESPLEQALALVWYELAGQNGLEAGKLQAERLRPSLPPAVVQEAQLRVRQQLEGGR